MHVPEELKKRYLDRKVNDLQTLVASLERSDFGPAIVFGHQIKGNAATFDFPRMGPIGVAIEKAGINRDQQELKDLVKKMMVEIESARLTIP